MAVLREIILDETTYYSTLGLSGNATLAEIHKSYMMLARQLHPDKSKSEASAEQFKLISHAHSVLMDKASKFKYDEALLSKGLLKYSPREGFHRHYEKKAGLPTENLAPRSPQRSASKHRRPYEQQPYGFGTESAKTSHSKVPIFQSFNLKNYERRHRPPETKKAEECQNHDLFTQKKRNNEKKEKSHQSSGVMESEIKARGRSAEHNESSTVQGTPGEREFVKTKLHKGNLSDPFEPASKSPFENHQERHYARKKHEARLNGKRSVSPIKATTSNSPVMSDTWDGLKDLLDKFDNQEPNDAAVTEDTNSGISDINSELPEKVSGKVRKPSRQSIRLDDLESSLPLNDKSFDMQGVSDMLNDVPVIKRPKMDESKEDSTRVDLVFKSKQRHSRSHMKHPIYLPQPVESLHMPVNQPLPKFYKSDVISLDQYKVDSESIDWELPMMPSFQCNFLDKAEVSHCKEMVLDFNAKCNSLKHKLLMIMHNRLEADQQLDDRLVKVENAANWVSCKDFDFEITNKLSELQNRQRIVAQSFASILKSMYASELG